MAISSIISFGFGNGTFSPGVALLPTLGYSNVPPYPGKTVCFQGESLRWPAATSETMRSPVVASESLRQPTVADEAITSC